MPGQRAFAIAIVVLCSCGSPVERSDAQATKLQLLVTKDPLVLETDHTLVLQVLVIGEGSDEATMSSPDLPAFATLQGSILTLSPSRRYQGDYTLTLVATAGPSTSSAILHLSVIRSNSAPTVQNVSFSDSYGIYGPIDCPSGTCTLRGTPSVSMTVGDADGDGVTIEVEAVQVGQVFSGYPTHSVTAPVGVDKAERCQSAYDRFHACIEVKLTGLATGQRYALAARVRDAFGANGVWLGYKKPDDGWVELGSFALEP